MNYCYCKQITVKRLKILGLVDDINTPIHVITALDLLGAIGISITPSTQIINGHVYYPCIELRFGEKFEDTEDIWPADETGDFGWENYSDMIIDGIDLSVDWLIANKSFILTDKQRDKVKEINDSIKINLDSEIKIDPNIDSGNDIIDKVNNWINSKLGISSGLVVTTKIKDVP